MSNNRSRLKRLRQPHKNNSTVVGSTGVSQPQRRYDIVEDWLDRIARPDSYPRPSTSQGLRSEVQRNSFLCEPLDATSPHNKHPRRVDPRWSPRHDFPHHYAHQSGSLFDTSALKDSRKSTRRRTALSNSSFISGFENTMKPPSSTPGSTRRDHVDIVNSKVLKDAALGALDASSTTSHTGEQPNFEKKPRRKTKEDKYEIKKRKHNHKERDAITHGIHQYRDKKRKKIEKRKSMTSRKNVMSNFTSNAVLNDRITVQPHLKPGLFDNGRVSKKQPISDLTFSDMRFLKQQSNTTQPKALSKSRLREKRREDREMEEVSSFFLLPKADANTHRPITREPDTGRNYQHMTHAVEQPTSTGSKGPSRFSPTTHREYTYSHIPRARNETIDTAGADSLESITDGKHAERDTTYLTWSSSHQSPRIDQGDNHSSGNTSGSIQTMTPELTRGDLTEIGTYHNFRIPSHDDHQTELSTGRKTIEREVPNVRDPESEDIDQYLHPVSINSNKVRYRDQAIMTEDPFEFTGLPDVVQKTQDSHPSKSPGEQNSHEPQASSDIDRQQIMREVRLTPIEGGGLGQHIEVPHGLDSTTTTTHECPELVTMNPAKSPGRQEQQAKDETSITSRDAMPPPPKPYSRNASLATPYDNVEFNAPEQNGAPANPEVSQVPHITYSNESVYGSQEPLKSCSQVMYESVANNGHALSNSSSATWTPRSRPPVSTVERGISLSRPTTISPTHVSQDEGNLSKDPCQKDLMEPREFETITEFIARIENESQWQFTPYENSSMSGLGEAALDSFSAHTGLSHKQPAVCNTEQETPLNLSPNFRSYDANTGMSRMDELCEKCLDTEAPYVQQGIGTPRVIIPGVVQSLEEFEDECLAMSSFWRPNRFSRF
ncbi:hypothetical protein K445DRAFT_26279 [Daldinia sp. EC12]|nr:hypothetical protein K445DRAFT_26279 [Daldinia sp. EC12]